MKKTVILSLAAIVIIGVFAVKKVVEPKTYEECVLKNVADAQTEQAALIVTAMCKKQFPPRYLTEDEVYGVK